MRNLLLQKYYVHNYQNTGQIRVSRITELQSSIKLFDESSSHMVVILDTVAGPLKISASKPLRHC